MEQHKKSYHNCAVDGCFNSTLNSDYSFFSIPLVPEKRKQWLTLICREDLINANCTHMRVCEAHFTPNFIIKNSRRKLLKKNAFPLMLAHLPKFAHKGIQTNIEIEKVNAYSQCSYGFQTNCQVQTPLHILKDPLQIKKVNAYAQCYYGFQTNSQVQTPLHLLKDPPQKRRILTELKRCRTRLKKAKNLQSDADTFLKLCDEFMTPDIPLVLKQETEINTQGRRKWDQEYDPSRNCSATPADQILVVPEPNDMIVNVYHYLQNEYKILKKSLAATGCDLSYLADIVKRTAEATGASREAVTKILRKRKRSQDSELDTAPGKRSKSDYYFDDDDVSAIEEDSGSEKEVCEYDRGAEDTNCSNDVRKTKPMDPLMETSTVEFEQTNQMYSVLETLKIEIEEQHDENTEAENQLISRDLLEPRLSQSTTAVQCYSSYSVSPTYVEVKIEPPDEDLQSSVHAEPCVHVTNDATPAPPPPPPGADTPSGPPPPPH